MIKLYVDVDVVKQLMEERVVDNKKMAELLGVSVPTVKRFLSGVDQSHYTINIIFKIARALNVSIRDVIHKNYQEIK